MDSEPKWYSETAASLPVIAIRHHSAVHIPSHRTPAPSKSQPTAMRTAVGIGPTLVISCSANGLTLTCERATDQREGAVRQVQRRVSHHRPKTSAMYRS